MKGAVTNSGQESIMHWVIYLSGYILFLDIVGVMCTCLYIRKLEVDVVCLIWFLSNILHEIKVFIEPEVQQLPSLIRQEATGTHLSTPSPGPTGVCSSAHLFIWVLVTQQVLIYFTHQHSPQYVDIFNVCVHICQWTVWRAGVETISRLFHIGKEKGTKSPHSILVMGCWRREEANDIIATKYCDVSRHLIFICDVKKLV